MSISYPVAVASKQAGPLADSSPQRVQTRKVYRRSAACAQGTRERPSPELAYGIGAVCYRFYSGKERVLMRLLDARLEEVCRLQENGGEHTRAHAREEVDWHSSAFHCKSIGQASLAVG